MTDVEYQKLRQKRETQSKGCLRVQENLLIVEASTGGRQAAVGNTEQVYRPEKPRQRSARGPIEVLP
jgi:hypothetical protein